MKKLTQITLLLLTMVVAFAGCEAAKDVADKAKDTMGFDTAPMIEQFKGITDGFADVNEENADELATKISDFDGTIDKSVIDKLPAPAKTGAAKMMSGFAETLKGKMDGLPDVVKSKLEPVVKPLMEKLASFGS